MKYFEGFNNEDKTFIPRQLPQFLQDQRISSFISTYKLSFFLIKDDIIKTDIIILSLEVRELRLSEISSNLLKDIWPGLKPKSNQPPFLLPHFLVELMSPPPSPELLSVWITAVIMLPRTVLSNCLLKQWIDWMLEIGFYVLRKKSISSICDIIDVINNLLIIPVHWFHQPLFFLFHLSGFCLLVCCYVSSSASFLSSFCSCSQVNSTAPGVIYYAIIRKLSLFPVYKKSIYFQCFERTSNGEACWFGSHQSWVEILLLPLGGCVTWGKMTLTTLTLQFPTMMTFVGWLWGEALRAGLGTQKMIYVCKWPYQPMKICHLFNILCEEYHLSKIRVYFSKTYKLFPCVCFPT